jgi:hypothetical protein
VDCTFKIACYTSLFSAPNIPITPVAIVAAPAIALKAYIPASKLAVSELNNLVAYLASPIAS